MYWVPCPRPLQYKLRACSRSSEWVYWSRTSNALCLVPASWQWPGQELLVHGAEAGDFGEWSFDIGIKLDLSLAAICTHNEEVSHKFVDKRVWSNPTRLPGLWGRQGPVSRWTRKHVLVTETGEHTLNSSALDRTLRKSDLNKGTQRVLLWLVNSPRHGYFLYQYNKIGHGWVSKLVDRPMVSSLDGKALDQAQSRTWKKQKNITCGCLEVAAAWRSFAQPERAKPNAAPKSCSTRWRKWLHRTNSWINFRLHTVLRPKGSASYC